MTPPPASPDGSEAAPEPGDWAALTGVGGTALAAATGLSAAEAIAAYDLSGKAGEVARLAARTPDGVIRLILLGVGDESPAELRRAGAVLARQLERGQRAVAVLPSDATRADAARSPRACCWAATRSRCGTAGPDPVSPATVRLLVPGPDDGTRQATVIAAAVALARDLINMPSDVKTPGWLADQAVEVAGRAGLGRAGPGRGGAGRGRIRRHRGRRGGFGASAPPDRAELHDPDHAGRATSCWPARASRSTAAGCRSSPTTACGR